ncbi:MAG: ABC transporter permease [Corallococcus sp.]|nr:ABC transporter permease [Bacillota bacterium]MCM1533370.1 ABC transporter permease [Corallococcus sp.]
MWKYVIKRVLLALLTTVIILSLTFIFIKLLPVKKYQGRPPQRAAYYAEQVRLGYIYATDTPEEGVEPADIVLFDDGTTTYYYQVPVLQQFGAWLKNILTKWDWGVSKTIEPNVKATVIIGGRLLTSMKINIISVLISVPVGIALGIWAALKKNTMVDHVISTVVMILISLPGFVLITFLMLVFCYNTPLLPTQWPNVTDPAGQKALGYILPVFCLSLGSICGYCRFVRAELCDVLSSDYLLLARTKGLTRRQAIMRHALRNAMVPIFPSILAEFIGIMGGSMVLEGLYGIPGIGSLFINSIGAEDYNILFVDMAIFTTIGLLAGVLLDLSYGFIDPRIRMGAKK